MVIGIDISQIVYQGTGVSRHVRNLVLTLIKSDTQNKYILFGASLRQLDKLKEYVDLVKVINPHVRSVLLPIPPTVVHFVWNILHIIPVEWIIGKVDIFWSSDWTTPPLSHAIGVSTIHDLIIFRHPEQFDSRIIYTQKKRLQLAKKEYQAFFCDSESTLLDAKNILNIDANKLHVVYSGV